MATKVDIGNEPYLRILLYGKPGSTKTRTACSAALDERTGPALLLNAAGNPISIRDYDPPPDIIDLEALKDVNAPYDWILKGQPESHPFCQAFDLNPPYKTLIVDQLTDIQRMSFAQVTGNKSMGPGDHPQRVQRQHFGSVLGQMVNFAKLYYSLPVHVIMTCLEKTTVNEATGAVTYSPLLWGQSDTEVPGYAYIVARLVHRSILPSKALRIIEDADANTTSVAFFVPSGTYLAKDQTGALGQWMADPTIGKMVDKIFN
jgi:hypothetical protein